MKKLFVILLFSAIFAQFDWQDNGLPLRQGVHIEWQRTGDVGGEGEMIFVWSDTRNGDRDIFAQKVDENGNALWQDGGIPVIIHAGRQEDPLIVSDGAGGFYCVWADYRDEPLDGDVYGQHVNNDGTNSWDASGVALSNEAGKQISPNLCMDNQGGAFAIWNNLAASADGEIYATHMFASTGVIAPGVGQPIISHEGAHQNVSLEVAGPGRANMVWRDLRIPENADIYAQSIDTNLNTLWSSAEEGGIAVAVYDGDQGRPKTTYINDNLSVMVWEDMRDEPSGGDVYIQFVDADGNMQLAENGELACNDGGKQSVPRVKGSGDAAYIIWEDNRANQLEADIYAQKYTLDGPQWDISGEALCVMNGHQSQPRLNNDANGGMYFVWSDERNASYPETEVYLQHVDAADNFSFENDGIVVCDAEYEQFGALVKPATDAKGFVVWADKRSGSIGLYVEVIDPLLGPTLDENGIELYYGMDGDALGSKSLYLGGDRVLVYWEDHRSTPFQTATYGQIVDYSYGMTEFSYGQLLSENAFQVNPEAVLVGDNIFLTFTSIDEAGTYVQYYQVLDQDLNFIGDPNGTQVRVPEMGLNQDLRKVVSGNDGYVYLAYSDYVNFTGYDVILQKYDEDGNSQWGSSGINISEDLGSFDNIVESIIAGPSDGCIVAWHAGFWDDYNIYAQFVNGDGDTPWDDEAMLVNDAPNHQLNANAVLAGNSIFLSWMSAGDSGWDIFGQVIGIDGTIMGPDEGITISNEVNDQQKVAHEYNNNGEVLSCWEDFQNGGDWDIYCNLTDVASATVSDEFPLATEANDQLRPYIFSSQDGRFMMTWHDTRVSLASDVYYQEMSGGEFQFQENGIVVCNADFEQINPRIDLYDENSDSYVIYWDDKRSSGKEPLVNVYLQSYTLGGGACMLGDLNDDSLLNVLDIVTLVNIIMGQIEPTDFQLCAGDVNEDGFIDVLDIVHLVNLIIA